MPLFLSPVCNGQIFDANGDPLTGGKIETYLAGSSTPAATYVDDTGSTPQSNPIILNSLGYPTLGPIWLTGGVSYKFVIKDASNVTLRTIDDISGVNDASVSQSEWVASGFTPTYISATSFSVPGDQTAILQINRRLRTTNTSGFVYSTISNSVFAAGSTTVTVSNDSATLDPGLTVVEYGLLGAKNPSIPTLQSSQIADKAVTFAKMQDVSSLSIFGRTASGSGSASALTPAQSAQILTSKVQPITASVSSNALTVTINPTTLDFRSATLGSGAVDTVSIPAPISLTVSNGSTLGTTNATLARLAVLAINNAGTAEVAIINLAGGQSIDETGLISTTAEGGVGAADSASVFYSAVARTNVPYRLVGYIESTQATAGTWATSPSAIQGIGGLALLMWLMGYGQTWQTVSRSFGTPYTNSTGRRITVAVTGGSVSAGTLVVVVSGVTIADIGQPAGDSIRPFVCFEVPPGATYTVSGTSGFQSWAELR
ncbi:hypothetical protein [Hydrogenophaga crocea]|uniref:Tail fiber protein n=1 Tax=Hydrogenophaga crocea TaxID=2716225 RepID=A0A6G8IET9_9BURK|nr:hypothetical protein [Hydrogenophaga crocea]QIM51629.1 hypothetical protein G9Q37_05485 [Hydrogenophaga crocea]